MSTTLSFEQLAEKLNGRIWEKGNIKRIYLDRGYNTKKMSTKTYVYQKEDGAYAVSCYIDCPSQDFNWIKSQQSEVIENVIEEIEAAIFSINNPDVDFYENKAELEEKKQLQKESADFEKNIDAKKISYSKDYERAVKCVKEFNEKTEALNSAGEEVKIKVAQLWDEDRALNGKPGSRNRRHEICQELELYPSKPMELPQWMFDAANFTTVEEYVDFKIIETRKSFSNEN